MRGAFRENRELERKAREREHFEPAILIIGLEQPVERQQGREQCGDPHDAGADPLQHRGLRTDAEREQHDREDKETEDEAGVTALPQGQAQVAPEKADEGGHP